MDSLVLAGTILALLFNFVIGMNDAANSNCHNCCHGVLSPVMAVAMERLPYREDFLQRFEAENSGLKEDKKTI